VYLPPTANVPSTSTNLLVETPAAGNPRLWVVNQDNDSITAFDAVTRARLGEVAVGADPRSIARAANGLLWVTNKRGASISVVDPGTRTVVRTLALPRASQPFGVAMSPTAATAFVALEAGGQVLRFDTTSYAQTGAMQAGLNLRQLSVSADGAKVYASRFITPPLPGEGTAVVRTPATAGAQVLEINAATMSLTRTWVLAHGNAEDGENQGRGVPNYLGAAVISPDGTQAYVPGKLDNVLRGTLRDGQALNFQNTVRAASSRLVLTGTNAGSEDRSRRVDHDNASLASAALFDRRGSLLFVALETSREVAVLDAHSGRQLMRFDVGRAPQGLALAPDGNTLFVNNFMDRSVGVFDLRPLLAQGLYNVPLLATLNAVGTEKLTATVLRGKQFFYDARDTRLARDSYMSCASCHSEGGHDGRTWDLTHTGEGLRNTISLRGRAGAQGRLHWTANFDEVQDFEAQIRTLAGGTGLMSNAQFNAGTRSQSLGDAKAGISADLDALSAYVTSLSAFDPSPARTATGALTSAATAGKAVFAAQCASCHEGAAFTDSAKRVLHQVGTQDAASGKRLFQPLNGLDAPTLRDVWATAPYLHNGSAATIEAAVRAHTGVALSAADMAAVVAYTGQIGAEETAAPPSTANLVVRALATLTDRVGALFEVRVNSTVVGAGQLDATGWVDLFFNVVTLVKDALIEVVFKNDASNATEDRNLAVQTVRVNGSTTLAATAPGAVIDAGSGAAAFDGVDTVASASTGGWLPWDGALRLRAPDTGGGDTVTVRGSATLAAGVGATVELYINGVRVASRTVANTTVQNLSFSTPPIAAGDRIDVVFSNDLFVNGEDRNLYVESVTARGTVLASTAGGVVLDAGSGAAAFDGVDVFPGGQFGGWIPWNAAMRFVAR
jgi:YVTN family beta-propeller protein